MSSMLDVGGFSFPVKCASTGDFDHVRPSSMDTSIGGVRWGVRPQRPNMDLALTWDLARPHELAMFLRLAYGEFGFGPFRLVEDAAAATNVLSQSVATLRPFVDNNISGVTVSGPVALDDGTVAGRHIITSGASLTPGSSFAAMAPVAGQSVTVSAYAQSGTAVRVRPLWWTAASTTSVIAASVSRPVAGSGPLTRVHATVTVPASVTPAGGVAGPVSRVGLAVLDTARVAAPAISWTSELTEWGMGGSPRFVMIEPPSASVIQAVRESRGLRASSVRMTAREVGLP